MDKPTTVNIDDLPEFKQPFNGKENPFKTLLQPEWKHHVDFPWMPRNIQVVVPGTWYPTSEYPLPTWATYAHIDGSTEITIAWKHEMK